MASLWFKRCVEQVEKAILLGNVFWLLPNDSLQCRTMLRRFADNLLSVFFCSIKSGRMADSSLVTRATQQAMPEASVARLNQSPFVSCQCGAYFAFNGVCRGLAHSGIVRYLG
ncbi:MULTISPECIES: hypothetical protein [Pseudomonas]|uniref:Uncharacterized protein n=1 Tax=Pseudomonas juntendi TaxID=2666183 RepID=A0A7W2JK86_9PSED|nr:MULTISPECIES: hypothetical protein [Pseudomonas]HBO8767863.1 hypothetical protein [Pseudomonas aeruginosa]EKT4481186.1 hypothetical protein [Pseudomonas putida]MBA6060552.1 hypothetical protein [Pseudomonas juntendi]UBM27865.1 hypothetical protein K8374_25505 [Pseudomonas sp. p1(2021b)]UFH30002.1 hypothetical protein LMH93_27200 [Pseudomonas sp. CIP-10]